MPHPTVLLRGSNPRIATEERTCTEPVGCVHRVTLRRHEDGDRPAHRHPGLRAVGLDYQQTLSYVTGSRITITPRCGEATTS